MVVVVVVMVGVGLGCGVWTGFIKCNWVEIIKSRSVLSNGANYDLKTNKQANKQNNNNNSNNKENVVHQLMPRNVDICQQSSG